MLDEYNKLVRVFRMARDRYESGASEDYSIRLIKNKDRGRQFDLPQGDEIAGLIVGGPRYMVENYRDAMAICRWYGNPDLFITITANPKWEEVNEHIRKAGNETANDRPDIECLIHTIEFQKRGLPHAHILLWLQDPKQNPNPEDIDSFITAELPDKEADPEGFLLVEQLMMHGPCGPKCMDDNKCTKKFPRPYNDTTSINEAGYITYRRRFDETKFVMKGNTKLDNRYVVPHNLSLLKKYKAHINVEWVNRSNAVKYLFKYITKGVDMATMKIEKRQAVDQNTGENESQEEINEIKNYLECRYLSAYQQRVVYPEGASLEYIMSIDGIEKTMLTEWFEMNKRCPEARELTYIQFPSKYVWNSDEKTWTERQQGFSIGRIVNIHPTAGDLYYLRMLVNTEKGPESFDDLLTVDNVKHKTFKAACYARGMLNGDSEWKEAMDEAAQYAYPFQLRHLFVTLLLYCELSSPLTLWEHCWRHLADDIPDKQRKTFNFKDQQFSNEELQSYTLLEIERILAQNDKSLTDFEDMPKPDKELLKKMKNSMLQDETCYIIQSQEEEFCRLIQTLNHEQKKVYDAVLDSIDNQKGKLFFLNGPGGTGKTYVYRTIISRLRSQRKIVLPVASSGIAAILLPNGRTAHSRFKIPIDLHQDSMCNISRGSMLSELLEKTDLIIWDEAPMCHRFAFEALDKS
ncbi:unnamed protein product, partial [Arabidopsis halleri]